MKTQILNRVTCATYSKVDKEPTLSMYKSGKFDLNSKLSELVDVDHIAFVSFDNRLFIIRSNESTGGFKLRSNHSKSKKTKGFNSSGLLKHFNSIFTKEERAKIKKAKLKVNPEIQTITVNKTQTVWALEINLEDPLILEKEYNPDAND